jgi:hypothetical protein
VWIKALDMNTRILTLFWRLHLRSIDESLIERAFSLQKKTGLAEES